MVWNKLSNYPRSKHLFLLLQGYMSTEGTIFIAAKQEKTNIAVIKIRIIVSFTLLFFSSNIKIK